VAAPLAIILGTTSPSQRAAPDDSPRVHLPEPGLVGIKDRHQLSPSLIAQLDRAGVRRLGGAESNVQLPGLGTRSPAQPEARDAVGTA
jgi:hypothetical protein